MNLTLVENRLLVVSQIVGVAAYDFNFDLHFACSHPYALDKPYPCILRKGPLADYEADYAQLMELGIPPVNTPEQHLLASELEHWYPRIEHLTARSRLYDELPDANTVEQEFGWPVFLKGSRQTSKHNPDLAIVKNADHYQDVAARYRDDPILHWQKPVLRELLPLMPLPGKVAGKVRPSVEFRTFWWYGRCIGYGPYWYQLQPYTSNQIEQGLALAAEAATLLGVPFLVIDIAQLTSGDWIIIECNDAQESGYVGVIPQTLWLNILTELP